MAVIHFTVADALATTVIATGYYPSIVSKFEGPKASGSGKSTNYFCDITVNDGQFKGKTRTIVFNTETNDPSILGSMQFFPEAYMLSLYAAVNNIPRKAEAISVDTDLLLHKPFEAKWAVHVLEGTPINIVTEFQPIGYSAQKPAF